MPAVGVVLRRENEDAVTRVTLRAIEHGYTVFITYQSRPKQRILDAMPRFNARIITPPTRTDDLTLLSALLDAAWNEGFPGLIFHENPSQYIDYEQTAVRISQLQSSVIRPVTTSYLPPQQDADEIVGIPAYNESETIGDVVARSLRYSDTVLVVDDGSKDGTPQIASEVGATVIRHETNKGYGGALKTIFREAHKRGAKRLVVLDGDGQHDPDDIPRLVGTQQSREADLVIGNRFADDVGTEMPRYRKLGLGVVNFLTNVSLGTFRRETWISDTQSGFRVYSERAIQTLSGDESINDGMGASTDILDHLKRHGYTVAEAGTEIDYDVENGSTHQPLSHGFVLASNTLKRIESRRPVTFIGIPGFALILSGLLIAYGLVLPLFSAGTIPMVSALVASILLLVGMGACCTSIILHAVNGRHDVTLEPTDG